MHLGRHGVQSQPKDELRHQKNTKIDQKLLILMLGEKVKMVVGSAYECNNQMFQQEKKRAPHVCSDVYSDLYEVRN